MEGSLCLPDQRARLETGEGNKGTEPTCAKRAREKTDSVRKVNIPFQDRSKMEIRRRPCEGMEGANALAFI